MPGSKFEDMARAVGGWAERHGFGPAVFVAREAGATIHAAGFDGGDPQAPHLLYSLSKAVTAACILRLIDDGEIAFQTPLEEALSKFIATVPGASGRGIAAVTIEQLLTHRSGLAGNSDGDDRVTGRYLAGYLQDHPPHAPPRREHLAQALGAGLLREPGSMHCYGNTGYLALAAVIEEATGATYESACQRLVFDPLGICARLDPEWAVLSGYGGWNMTAPDFLNFLDVFDETSGSFSPSARAWIFSSAGKEIRPGAEIWYSAGLYMKRGEEGIYAWHNGLFDFSVNASSCGALNEFGMRFALRWPDGASVYFATLECMPSAQQLADIERSLYSIYRG